MAQKKDPYGRIKQRFIEERAEDKGWDELSVDQRQRLANRFDVLAASVEGRGKIARTILPDAPQERRKALRQRVRQNLPTSKSSTSIPEIPSVSSPAGRIGSPSLGGYTSPRPVTASPKTTTSTTKSTSAANTRRQVTGEFGSTYQPSAFANWAAETKIPVVSDIIGPGIPVARVVRQGARELDEAYMAFKQGEVKEGLKNVAGVGRELAFGAFDAGLVKGVAYGAAKGLPRVLPAIAKRPIIGAPLRLAGAATKATAKGIDNAVLGGLGQAVSKKFSRGKVSAVNETRPVVSSVERTVASEPVVRQQTTASAVEPKIKGQPRRSVPRKQTKTVEPEVAVEPVTRVSAPSSPTKAPEVVPQTKVEVAGTTPPTEFQKTVTPEQFTAPATQVETAPATATAPVKKPRGTRKSPKTKTADTAVEVTPVNKVEPAKSSPAPGEVVGGATPKATGKLSSPVPSQNLPNVSESSKTSVSPVEVSTVASPRTVTPDVAVVEVSPAKKTKKPKLTKEQKAQAKAEAKEARKFGLTSAGYKIRTQVESVQPIINPATGQPVINPKTGAPATRTVYKSQRKIFEEADAARAARRAERAADAQVTVVDLSGKPASAAKVEQQTTTIEPITKQAKEDYENARREMTVRPSPDPETAAAGGLDTSTLAGAIEDQVRKAAQVTRLETLGFDPQYRRGIGTPTGGEYVTTGRRTLGGRRRPPRETSVERLERQIAETKEGVRQPLPGQFDEKHGTIKEDPRTPEQIRQDYEERLKYSPDKLTGTKTAKQQKEQADLDKLTQESTARQRDPQQVKEERKAARKQRLLAARAKKAARQQRGSIIIEGERRSVSLGRLVAEERKASRRQRVYKKDINQPLHAFQVDESNLKRSANIIDEEGVMREVNDMYFETVETLSEASTNLKPRRSYVADPPESFGPPKPERPAGVEFFEMNPKTMDYEQLLAVEQAGFKLQVSTGAPTRFSRDRGVRGVFTRPVGEGMDPAQFKTLMKSTEYSRQDLLKLIKSTNKRDAAIRAKLKAEQEAMEAGLK